jgi:hypothetical protein
LAGKKGVLVLLAWAHASCYTLLIFQLMRSNE